MNLKSSNSIKICLSIFILIFAFALGYVVEDDYSVGFVTEVSHYFVQPAYADQNDCNDCQSWNPTLKACQPQPCEVCCDNGECDKKGEWEMIKEYKNARKTIDRYEGEFTKTEAYETQMSRNAHDIVPNECEITKWAREWSYWQYIVGERLQFKKEIACTNRKKYKTKFEKTGGPYCEETQWVKSIGHLPLQQV